MSTEGPASLAPVCSGDTSASVGPCRPACERCSAASLLGGRVPLGVSRAAIRSARIVARDHVPHRVAERRWSMRWTFGTVLAASPPGRLTRTFIEPPSPPGSVNATEPPERRFEPPQFWVG
jgi:hypothetical protein